VSYGSGSIEHVFDVFHSWATERLVRERDDLVAQQRRLHARELAVLAVLDERGRVDCSRGADGESGRTVREKVETARALEALPCLAAVAHDGRLSPEQLAEVTKVADESTDAEWAERAPGMDPADLARLARRQSKPTAAESRARREARSLRMWWDDTKTMLSVRGQLPDELGARFEATVNQLVEQLRPAKGQAWDSYEHRAADALLALCDADGDDGTPSLAARSLLQVLVPLEGPAEIAGIPIADSLLEQLRANATIEPMLVDDHGARVALGRRAPALSPKIARAVVLRDGHCRMPGCTRRVGLEVHHLEPRSWGGSDDFANLAAVCPTHHRRLVPHGRWKLTGNPNLPDRLTLVDADDLPPPRVA
jgi:hypothetical protein